MDNISDMDVLVPASQFSVCVTGELTAVLSMLMGQMEYFRQHGRKRRHRSFFTCRAVIYNRQRSNVNI